MDSAWLENEELMELSKARSYKVVKSNEMVQQTRFELTAQQQRIVQFIISKIDTEKVRIADHPRGLELKFDIQEYCKMCGINDSGKNYKEVKSSIQELRDKSRWIEFEEYESLVAWIDRAWIYKGSGTVKVNLHEDLL